MAGKKKERVAGRRILYNIGAMQVSNHSINCPACHQTTVHADLSVRQMVDCNCGKQFDCVWYRPVSDPKQLEEYLQGAAGILTAYDFETDGDEESGNDEFTHNLVGCSFCRMDQRGVAIYVPLRHTIGQNMPEDVFKSLAAPFMRDNPMAVHAASFMEWPYTYVKLGVEPKIVVDSCIVAYLQDANRAWTHDPRNLKLKGLAKEIFDIDVTALQDLVDLNTGNFGHVPVAQAYAYGCQDSDLTIMLVQWGQEHKVQEEQPNIWRVEHDLIPVVAKMHLRGIQLNPDHLVEGAKQLDKKIEELEQEVFQLMGFEVRPDEHGMWQRPFDLGSNKQVAEQLFTKMGIPYDQRSVGKSGVPSTSKDALEDIKDDWPVVAKVLEHRGEVHSRDNYVAALPTYVNAVTGFIHGYFNQVGAPTGRFSHSSPNLANQAKIRD